VSNFRDRFDTSSEKETFVYKPILHALPAKVFLTALESLSNSDKKSIAGILRKRYKEQNVRAMKDEVEWIKDV
jgi:hypothetical protein